MNSSAVFFDFMCIIYHQCVLINSMKIRQDINCISSELSILLSNRENQFSIIKIKDKRVKKYCILYIDKHILTLKGTLKYSHVHLIHSVRENKIIFKYSHSISYIHMCQY